ncbi:hypothetical protein [Lactococcus lactis]|uniref:hypothetical protein n=1 Tax=Lactococcus lactis TaxID=1358 RepID=UPI0035A594EA
MSVKFKGNFNRVDRAIKKALNPTSVEFAKKANKYVKKDTGATESSVWSASNFDKGQVIWDTDYAAYAYSSLLVFLESSSKLKWVLDI